MRILLLGGTGAMGVSLVEQLALYNHDIYVTSRKPHESYGNIHYILGNAHNSSFIEELLRKKFDTIVDFMSYTPNEFNGRVKLLLDSSNQYIFLSSARVYADSDIPLVESSSRLLDVCTDQEYLETNEYALAKAREENILFESGRKNWTIIRPYITYNTGRLQLGSVEKDIWLWRALRELSVPFPKDIASCKTTLTYGKDVALLMARLIGCEKAKGEVFQIVGSEVVTWKDVADIYAKILKEETGKVITFYSPGNSTELSNVIGNQYQVFYDRLYNRVFDNKKIIDFCGSDFQFTPLKEGLNFCVREFIKSPEFKQRNLYLEAYLNRKTGENPHPELFSSTKDIWKYYGFYYTPTLMNKFIKLKKSSFVFRN